MMPWITKNKLVDQYEELNAAACCDPCAPDRPLQGFRGLQFSLT